mmetsp:Transcript_3739/g.3463  ORF Transcript_3739/g.3463 Transcript_3739/m.3463 type:complete len:115 (+) Transcript_3739:1734-2078(+)
MMRNSKLQLDCLLSLGYISFEKAKYEDAKQYYNKAYKCARQLQEPEIAQQCMCNVGVCIGNSKVQQMRDPISNIKKTTNFNKMSTDDVSDTESEAIEAMNISASDAAPSVKGFN